jgi:8-oxo-dGTP diphosphatase
MRGFPLEVVGVVVGIVVKEDKFLVERRRMDEKVDPGIVCLPAGHVEPNESLDDALKREMLEELGIKVTGMQFVCRNYYVASNGEQQHACCYLITGYEGEPVCRAAQEIFWEEDVNKMSLEVDRKTVTKMRELQKEQKISSHSKLNCTHEGKPRSDQ